MTWDRIKYNIPDRPDILFVGINPHPGSYSRGVPFSNNKNFWYNLSRSGLIDIEIDQLRQDEKLRVFYTNVFSKTYGFMNIINRPTENTTMLRKDEEKKGIIRIKNMIRKKKPLIVCFVGKITFSKFSGQKKFHLGLNDTMIYESIVYIASFPIRGPNILRIRELTEIKSILKDARAKRRI
jgi:TDG/mug DNA glycosylase family protein